MGNWVNASCFTSVETAAHKNALVESDTSIHLCGKSGLSEDSLMKCKQMAVGSWMKASCSISV